MTRAEIGFAIYVGIGFALFVFALRTSARKAFAGPAWQDFTVACFIIYGWLPMYLFWALHRLARKMLP